MQLTMPWRRLQLPVLGLFSLSLLDLGILSVQVANLDKDVVVPYHSLMPPFVDDSGPWAASRPTLLFFRGNMQRQQVSASARLVFSPHGARNYKGGPM